MIKIKVNDNFHKILTVFHSNKTSNRPKVLAFYNLFKNVQINSKRWPKTDKLQQHTLDRRRKFMLSKVSSGKLE